MRFVKSIVLFVFCFSTVTSTFAESPNFAKTNSVSKTSSQKINPAPKAPPKPVETPEMADRYFYANNFERPIKIYEPLAQNVKDRNYALWNNQLGSLYLAQGDHEKALTYFLNAFYLMNNVAAFKELENRALGLTGSEDKKAYKGDPYEKMYNSLYTGLLLYKKGDLENARAAFKNGILSSSDVAGELYKSNEPLLYLFLSRIEYLSGDSSMGQTYFEQAQDVYRKIQPINRDLVSKEQFYRDEIVKKQDELNKIIKSNTSKDHPFDKKNLSKRSLKQFEDISKAIADQEKNADEAAKARESNNASIKVDFLKNFINKDINTFLIIEAGRGPIKERAGKYGEMAVFREESNGIHAINISIDDRPLAIEPVIASTFYQATTRGGRKMDAILKGKAQFKNEAANTSKAMFATSLGVLEQGRQSNPNNDPNVAAGYVMVAGALAIVGIGSAILSSAANPAADVRHWGYLPNELWVMPLKLSPGSHKIEIKPVNYTNTAYLDLVKTVYLNIAPSDNINFVRVSTQRAAINASVSNERMVATVSYDNEKAAKDGVTNCVLYTSSFDTLTTKIPIKSIVDSNIKKTAENLKKDQCSDALSLGNGKYYVLKGIN